MYASRSFWAECDTIKFTLNESEVSPGKDLAESSASTEVDVILSGSSLAWALREASKGPDKKSCAQTWFCHNVRETHFTSTSMTIFRHREHQISSCRPYQIARISTPVNDLPARPGFRCLVHLRRRTRSTVGAGTTKVDDDISCKDALVAAECRLVICL